VSEHRDQLVSGAARRRRGFRGNPAGFDAVMEEVTEPDIFFRHPTGQGAAGERDARP